MQRHRVEEQLLGTDDEKVLRFGFMSPGLKTWPIPSMPPRPGVLKRETGGLMIITLYVENDYDEMGRLDK